MKTKNFNMKKLFSLFFLVIMLGEASGQNADQKWGIGLFGGKTEYVGELGNGFMIFDPFVYGHAGLAINRYLNPSFDLSLQGEYGSYGFYESSLVNFMAKKTDAAMLLKYKLNNGFFFKEDAVIAPFLATGVGFASFAAEKDQTRTRVDDWDAFIPLGGGIRFNVLPQLALQYQILYNFTNGDTRDLNTTDKKNDRFISHSIGIIINIGALKDTDKDGVPDKSDRCPGTPGGIKVTVDGCPIDGDRDGIADYLDKCPDVTGLAAFSGCPDTDGDGIEDSMDDCPDVKGLPALKGCPDKDGDGIKDSEDKCPDVKGIAALAGCPDADGDGITDKEDKCPAVKGTKELNGCPDADGDGIADSDDKCPLVAGIKENKGCPEVKEEVIKVFTQALTGILFETGKDVIRPSSFTILNDVVRIMKENPEFNLVINGHTDNVGDDAKNLDLSQRRADAVKKYLADNGVEAGRMTSKGFGETMPVAENNTAAGRTKNRRVEFKVNF